MGRIFKRIKVEHKQNADDESAFLKLVAYEKHNISEMWVFH